MISPNSQRVLVLALFIAAAVGGCSKKEASTAGSAPDTRSPVQASGSEQVAAGQAVTAVSSADATKILNEANAALKAKDYEKAVEATLAAQRQRSLTDAQMAAMHNQMIQLQRDLANAINSGDAKAKAAADLLRRSASGAQ